MASITDNQKQITTITKRQLENALSAIGTLSGLSGGASSAGAVAQKVSKKVGAEMSLRTVAFLGTVDLVAAGILAMYGLMQAQFNVLSDVAKGKDDWAIKFTTTYAFTGWSGGYPTYNKIVSMTCKAVRI